MWCGRYWQVFRRNMLHHMIVAVCLSKILVIAYRITGHDIPEYYSHNIHCCGTVSCNNRIMYNWHKYIRESKIIRIVGTYFAVCYTAGWAWQDTHGLLLSYYCGAGVTLIVHFCQEFFAINMDTPNFICTKKEQRAVIHFCGLKVYQVSKCIECQCSMRSVVSQRIVC